MRTILSNYLLVLTFLLTGCSSSKNTTVETNSDSEDDIVYYHVSIKSNENEELNKLIENRFKELENLELEFVKIHFDKKENIKFDCEMDLTFDELTITDKEYNKNKHFSKILNPQRDEINASTSPSTTIIGYLNQRINERKLNWNVKLKANSNSDKCLLKNKSFSEKIISKSINNTLSGTEDAIPKKYRKPIGDPLLSRKEITEEALERFYKKTVNQLKQSQ